MFTSKAPKEPAEKTRTTAGDLIFGQRFCAAPVEAIHARSSGGYTTETPIFWNPSQYSSSHQRQYPQMAAKAASGADRRCHTPSSRPHKRVKMGWETDLGEEEREFILYLGLQNIRPQAIAVELTRMTLRFSNLALSSDEKVRVMSRKVVKWLRSFQLFKGTEEAAERMVSDLLAQGEKQGWSTGPLSRARDYSKSLSGGKGLFENRKSRLEEARCRAALKKWRIERPGIMPRSGLRVAFERRAYDGIVLEAAQALARPDKESMKRNLLEFWAYGTIGGKAIE
ncbi:hypothetical protein DV735_g5496, partial [Chaetothyriales sp. CBS 134920]